MIDLDFALQEESHPPGVDWRSVSELELRYYCFIGDVILRVGGVDFSTDWGWVPVLDFAIAARQIGDGVALGHAEEFDFTESAEVIQFDLVEQDRVRVQSSYAPGAGLVSLGEFDAAVRSLLRRVREVIERAYPDLLLNRHYRRSLGPYW